MKHFIRSKLMRKYLIVSLTLAFISLAILYLITNHVMYNSVRGEIENRNQLMAKTVGKNTNHILSNTINDMIIVSVFRNRVYDDSGLYKLEMEKIISSNPLYYHVKVFNAEKEVLINIPDVFFSETHEEEYNIIDRMSWTQTFYISNMFVLDDGRETIAVSYPVFDQKDVYIGGVVAYINLHSLSRSLNQVKIGNSGMNVLIDRMGNIIGSNDESHLGYNIADHPLAENLYKSKTGVWDGNMFGEEMTFAYRPVQLGSFGILVGEPVEQAIAPVGKLQKLLLQAFIIGLILTFLFTIGATFKIVKPITNLTRQAREYKESKRSIFNIVKTGDELEDLSITMDEMAKELTSKEKRVSHILESIPYGVITTNNKGDIVTFNKGAEALTLYTRDEVIGKKINDIALKKTKNEYISWKVLQEGKKFDDVESYILDRDGNSHDVRMYSSLFYDEGNQSIGALLIFRDVSEIKKMEEDLKYSEHMASLGLLTAGIAHEIKNPLSIIHAAAEAIQLDLHANKTFIAEMIDDILETSDRMDHLLTDFLELSKGDLNHNKESVDLIVLLNELLLLLRKRLDEQDITFASYYEVSSAKTIAIENQLNQLFLNILINSIQSMESGGVLTVGVNEDSTHLIIEISDTGKGISESELKWIFNPFYTTKKEGTGLGLSIAYRIIAQHNGKIEVKSRIGEGTTLTVRLPRGSERSVDE